MSPTVAAKLPTHLELPCEDGIPMDSDFQPTQAAMLSDILSGMVPVIRPDGRMFMTQDTGIYYRLTEPRLRGCKSPDWFCVPGKSQHLRGIQRRSYVMWHERTPPPVIIELASGDGSEERDATPHEGKFWVYEQALQTEFYAIYEFNDGPEPGRLEVYRLVNGRYVLQAPNRHGRYPLPPIRGELGLWQGTYRLGATHEWLRFWGNDGTMWPTGAERAVAAANEASEQAKLARAEKRRANLEKARAEEEKARADRLAAMLRQMGIDPDATE